MKALISILALTLIAIQGSCQFTISANASIGTFKMTEMKSFVNQLAASYPVTPRISPSFPSY
ncbi:MAG TPA: hypothetical protein VL443_06815, partial [Cyclobacteriaceae bacterium]|nr:hypothetical protein [Cyclobacteriaceae bacterium]